MYCFVAACTVMHSSNGWCDILPWIGIVFAYIRRQLITLSAFCHAIHRLKTMNRMGNGNHMNRMGNVNHMNWMGNVNHMNWMGNVNHMNRMGNVNHMNRKWEM